MQRRVCRPWHDKQREHWATVGGVHLATWRQFEIFFSGANLFCVQEAGKNKEERKIVNVS